MILASVLLCIACQVSMDDLLDFIGSEDPARRSQVSDQLLSRWKEWTDGDLEKLDRKASSRDAEVAGRAMEIARRIGLRKRLGPERLQQFPDADRNLCVADEEVRLNFLLDASNTCKRNSWPPQVVRSLALNAGTFPQSAASGRLHSVVRTGQHWGLVPLLFPLLRHESPDRRFEAVDSVRELGTKDDCRALLPCLDDGDPKIRTAAVYGVGYRLRSAAALALKPLFKDTSPEVRHALVEAVGQGRIAELADGLLPFLADSNPNIRMIAARSLGRTRSRVHARAMAALLDDPEPGVRSHAAEALGEMRAREYAATVVRLLEDPNAGVRQMAARGLGTMDANEHADALAALLADPEENTRSDIAYLLARWNQRTRTKDILPLLRSDKTRRSAIFSLQMLEAKETTEALMAVAEDRDERLRSGFDTNDRGFALEAVGALGALEMAPRIVALLKDKDEELRSSVFEALSRLGDVGRIGHLIEYLIDRNARSGLARALAMFGSRDLAPQIAQYLGLDRWTTEEGLIALGGIGGEDARKTILEQLKDPQDYPPEAVASLAKAGRPEDMKALFPFLDNDRRDIVAIAIGELAARGGPERKTAIERLAASKSLGAGIALARLGQKTPKEQAALFDEILRPLDSPIPNEPPIPRLDFGPDGVALNRAMEAIHEPNAFALFEKEIVLATSLESLEDLRDLLRTSGFTLDVAPARRWGRLPKGIRTTLRAVCDWMLNGNAELEIIDDHGTGYNRRVVLQGSTVKLLRLKHQADYWVRRLDIR